MFGVLAERNAGTGKHQLTADHGGPIDSHADGESDALVDIVDGRSKQGSTFSVKWTCGSCASDPPARACTDSQSWSGSNSPPIVSGTDSVVACLVAQRTGHANRDLALGAGWRDIVRDVIGGTARCGWRRARLAAAVAASNTVRSLANTAAPGFARVPRDGRGDLPACRRGRGNTGALRGASKRNSRTLLLYSRR